MDKQANEKRLKGKEKDEKIMQTCKTAVRKKLGATKQPRRNDVGVRKRSESLRVREKFCGVVTAC